MTSTTKPKPTSKPTKMVWLKDLPAETRGRPTVWPERVALLKERPGVWVDATATFGIGGGSALAAKRAGLDASTRKVNGERRLFVRYPEGKKSR